MTTSTRNSDAGAAPEPTDLDLDQIAAEAAAASAQAASGEQPVKKRPARRSSPFRSAIPVIAAVVLTTALQLAIDALAGADSYLFRLFRPPGGWIMSLVPAIIVFLLVWTLVDLLLKYLDGRANESDLERREIRQLPSLISTESVASIQRRILSMDSPDRPVARRLLWLLYYLDHNADAQRTHELLRHQADLDADTAAAGYRTAKLFIWAMPILGFVGTVLGISLAVGGFSTFLTANMDIDDVSRVTAELGSVASGLSFAFDTTLLGLLAGLVANVVSSGVQKRDERFFTRLEELGLSMVANSRAGAEKPRAAGTTLPSPSDPDFEATMQARLEEIGGLLDRTRQVMQGLSETSARVNAGLNQSMDEVRRTVDELGRSVQGMSEALAADAASQASVEQAVARLSDSIATFGEGLAELRAEQNTLAPILEQLAGPLELRLVPGRGAGAGAAGATGAGGRAGGPAAAAPTPAARPPE